MDWFSRYVLAWEVSVSLETSFCVSALNWALECGRPDIFNTDQGSQFTSHDFSIVIEHLIKVPQAKKENDDAISQLREAVTIQDGLKYNEPQDWFYPVRESLGAALLMNGDQAGAEQVFRDDLERNPRNPRSLFGLEQALKAQDKAYDAGFVRKQFDASWKGTARPTVEDLV